MHTTLLAAGWNGGPGPWILLVPLFWISIAVLVRRVIGRRLGRGFGRRAAFGHGGPGGPGGRGADWYGGRGRTGAPTPVETLNRKYADGEIDEFEYRQRYDLLTAITPQDAEPTP
jgi:putative membrane protein